MSRFRRLMRRLGTALLMATALSMPASVEAAEVVHVVSRGQTLVAIARRYRTTAESIREANGLRPGQLIKPGLELVIPAKGKEAEAKKAAAQRAAKAEATRKGNASAPSKPDAKKGDPKKKDIKADGRGRKSEAYVQKPKRPGFVKIARGPEKFEGQLLTRHGRLVPGALAGVTRMLRHFPSNTKTPIDPRLATLIGMVSDHFGGRTLHVVSGFRPVTPTQYTKHSNHNIGRAFDFTVEGVPNTVLRDFCRTFRNAGVGYYPNSTFVHLDVRTTKVYWVDYARAGEAPKYDSPGSKNAADESADDVDAPASATPAAGTDPKKEAAPTNSSNVDGSIETQSPPQ